MKILILIILLLLVAFCAAVMYFYRTTFLRSKKSAISPGEKKTFNYVYDREFFEMPERQLLEIESFDGLKLRAYFYDCGGKTSIIYNHGYKSSALKLSGLASAMFSKGYNALIVCERAHELSEGTEFSMGFKERFDLLGWTEKIDSLRPGGQVVWFGWSMGGSIVLNALGEKIPDSLVCAVSDCSYENLYDQLVHSAKLFMPSFPCPSLIASGLDLYCRIFKRFPLKVSAAGILERCTVPCFFIHGTEDHFVPYENLDILYSACASRKLRSSYPHAAHVSSFGSDPERYVREMNAFIEEYSH